MPQAIRPVRVNHVNRAREGFDGKRILPECAA